MNSRSSEPASEHAVELSVVIPAYNEERRLGRTLTETLSFLALRPGDWEVLVVDDGSRDRTADIVSGFAEASHGRVQLLRNPGNRGKGFAVRHGVMSARGRVVLFFDADLSTPLHEVDKVVGPILGGEYDVVIGSRGQAERASQPLVRQFISSQFRWLRRQLVGLDFYDTQCGFKAMRREAAHAICAHQTVEGFAFDVELLMLARDQQWRVHETSVEWHDQAGSTVSPVRSSLAMLRELVGLRISWRKRRLRREPLQAAIRLVGPDGTAEDARMDNVHREGMFVRTARVLEPGDRVTLLMPLPDGEMLTLYGRVAHREHDPARLGVGVQFVGLERRASATLDDVIARLRTTQGTGA